MKLVIGTLISTMIVACGGSGLPPKSTWTPEQLQEKKQLVKEVMEVHDSTMIYMDKIHQSIDELTSLKLNKDSTYGQIDSAIGLLETADDGMMSWMRSYREPKDTIDYNMAKNYLIEQKNAIQQVETQTELAIKFSSSILNNVKDSVR